MSPTQRNPTQEQLAELKAKAHQIWIDAEKTLTNLYSRWLDEKEYEDIAEYGKVVKPIIEKNGGTFLKMNRSPFGFNYLLGPWQITVKINRTTYTYEETKHKIGKNPASHKGTK